MPFFRQHKSNADRVHIRITVWLDHGQVEQ